MKSYGTDSRTNAAFGEFGRLTAGASRITMFLAAVVAVGAIPSIARAQSGVWTQVNTGSVWNWGNVSNWNNGAGPIANGANNSATFATAGLSTGVLINLDTARTIGSLEFDNPSTNFGWTIQGTNTLTLSNSGGPTIDVATPSANAAITATISTPLASASGFTKTGPGLLNLTANNTSLSGNITISGGILGVTAASGVNPLGTSTVTLAGGTLRLGNPSGYNQQMVVPVSTPGPTGFAASGVTATMDGGATNPLVNYTWYAQGQNPAATSTGLPMGTTFTSATGSGYQYALPASNTTTNNTLLLDAQHPTGRLVLATPTTGLSTISFLTSSANVGIAAGTILPVIQATIHYSDGTPDVTDPNITTGTAFNSPDWFSNTTTAFVTNPAFQAGGRISATGYSDVVNPPSAASHPNLFDEFITNPNPSNPISSIDLSWAVGSGGTQTTIHTVVMALGAFGAPIPIAGPIGAQSFTNAVSVTANSTIDIQTSAGSSVGAVTIGSNTLSVTSGYQANPALTLGTINMTGNPIFNVGPGIVVTAAGGFTDGGTVRTVTVNGSGTFVGSVASPSLQAGTGLTINGGSVNLNNATAFGPSPAVSLNAGNLNIGASTNPTLGSLSGSGITGVLTLNGNAVTIKTSGSASYAGSIVDGSAPGSLVMGGTGTQSLTGLSNTFTGGVKVNSGILASSPGSMGTGVVTLAGGTLAVGPSTPVSVTGFGGTGVGWTANGTSSFPATDVYQPYPNAGGQAGSVWFNTKLPTNKFTIQFTLTNLAAGGADGITVGFQNQGLTALGGGGGLLGYGGITPSAALGMNIYTPNTVGGNGSGIGFVTNGAAPNGALVPSTAPVNFGNQNSPTNVTITFDGTNASVMMTQGTNTFSSSTAVPFAGVGNLAYFGFTGATGGVSSQLQVSNLSITIPASAGVYNNNVSVTSSSTIQVTATATVPTVSMGALTMAAGTTLNVVPDPANPAGTAFGLTFTGTTLNGASTFAVSSGPAGAGTLTLGTVTNGSGTGSITITGGGTVLMSGGNVLGNANVGSSSLTLLASTSLGSLTGTTGTVSNGTSGPITLTIGSDGTSTTFGGTISDGTSGGTLALIKTGFGTTTLAGTNTYSGGTTISQGTLSVASDAALGTGTVTIGSLGILNYNSTTSTGKSFNLGGGGTITAGAGATVTLTGGTVVSGYLGGSGTFATSPASATRFAADTAQPAVTINSNNPGDQFINFTNGGTLNIAANLTPSATATFNGFNNQGGTVNIGANSVVTASGFQSYGVLNLPPGSRSTGGMGATELVNQGGAPLYFNGGSRTFLGSIPTASTFAGGIDLNGQNAIVAGGLFVNNGFVIDSTNSGHTVIADYGALVKGAGFFQYSPVTQNGGRVQAGNSPGVQTEGTVTLGPGGTGAFTWQINNATGVAGPTPDTNNQVSGWSLIKGVALSFPVTTHGDLNWTATASSQFNFALQTLTNPTTVGNDIQGLMANWNNGASPFSFAFVQFAGTYTGPTSAATLNADTVFDFTNFVNPHPGTFGWNLTVNSPAGSGGELDLVYTPIPEPGALALTGLAGLAMGWVARRRRAQKAAAKTDPAPV